VRERIWTAGFSQLTLAVADLPAGLYTLLVENAEGVGVRKLTLP